jgi:tRNA modification GTPase
MTADRAAPIAAIATAPGRGGVGIVRISSPADITPLALALSGKRDADQAMPARQACYLPLLDATGEAIDHGIVLRFTAPHSYTGEHVLELQAHGGPVVLQLLLARCLQVAAEPDPVTGRPLLRGLRLARPGEFTERAFLNGKLDLAQAEAVADLIDASTEAAARGAGRSLDGVFSTEVTILKDALIHLRMLVEATLDFPEEEIDFLRKADARGQLSKLEQMLIALLGRAKQGALLREGLTVVIAGQPNAGKSSLLNALAGAELAIVTPVAGTTRDKVTQTIQIEGVPIHVIDTAGLRDSDDTIEAIGIARAWDEIGKADAVLFLHDLTRVGQTDYQQGDRHIAAEMARRLPDARQVPVIDVWNKSDIAQPNVSTPSYSPEAARTLDGSESPGIALSAMTGVGLEELRQRLLQVAGWQPAASEGVFLARERHLEALREVDVHLAEAALHLAADAGQLDLLAEELRLAQNALSRITGAFGADDLLGVIFSRFCIGK